MEKIFLIDMDTEVTDLIFTTTTATSSSAAPAPAFVSPPDTLDQVVANDTDSMNFDENKKMQLEQVSVQPESVETKRGAPKKYNLRKSLAWDSAFFTCEGVLDPDELAAVNSKVGKMGIPSLPGIQEDVRKSFESNATLDSIQSIELGLFESSKISSTQKPPENNGKECKNVTVPSQKLVKSTMTFNKNKNNVGQVKPKISSERVQQRMDNNRNGGLKTSLKPPRIASGKVASNKKNSAHEPIQGKNNKSYKTLSGNSDAMKSIVLSKKIGTKESYQSVQKASSFGKISIVPNPYKKIPSTGSCSASTGSKGFHAPDIKSSKKNVDSVIIKKSTKDVAASKTLPKVFKSKKEQCEISIGESERFSSSSFLLNESFDSMGLESSFSSISTSNSLVSSTEIHTNKPSMLIGHSQLSLKRPCSRMTKSKIVNSTSVSDVSSDQQGKICLETGSKPSGLRLPSPKFGYVCVEKSATCNSTTSEQVLPSASCQNITGINKPMSNKIKAPTVDNKANSSFITTLPSFGEESQMTSKSLSELASNLQSEAKPEASHESLFEKKNSNQNELHLPQHAKLLEGDQILTSDLLHSQLVSGLVKVTKSSDKENMLPSPVK